MAESYHRRENLKALSILQLGALYDVSVLACDLFLSLQNMPVGDGLLHEIAEEQNARMGNLRGECHDECLTREPSDTTEAAILAGIIGGEADNSDEWEAAAKMIARGWVLHEARYHAAHQRYGGALETEEA